MSKVPPLLLKKLAQLRRRERLLHLAWGLARLVSLVVVVLLAACLADWLVDLWDDTPWSLREAMLGAQVLLAMMACLWFVVIPQFKRMHNRHLALLVESKKPQLQHRLISALELNEPNARTAGMSPELMAATTREAETLARPMSFAAVADHSRLKHSLRLVLPVVLVAAGLFFIDSKTALALLQRQALLDVDIPRTVSLAVVGAEIWPGGEEVKLKFAANGLANGKIQLKAESSPVGWVRVSSEDGRSFGVPLTFETAGEEGAAIYTAKVPPASVDFSYHAKLSDGRTRSPGHVHYVARPSVTKQVAHVILPTYLGLRPDGTPYEQAHQHGDILGMQGLSARVDIETQKPIDRAVLETYGSPYPDLSGSNGLTKAHERTGKMLANVSAFALQPGLLGPLTGLCAAGAGSANVPLRRFVELNSKSKATQIGDVSISPKNEMTQAAFEFDLRPTETSYGVTVFDEYGFKGKTQSVRTIKIEPEPAPTVTLHPELWDPPPIFNSRSKTTTLIDFEGMPLPLVDDDKPGPVRVSFEAHGPYGIGKAQLKVGVIRGGNASEGDGDANPKLQRWVTLPLHEVAETDRTFDKTTGAFTDSDDKEAVPLYAVPSSRPAVLWPRTTAGGRLDFQPAGILDESGKPFAFKQDDRIVVYVEVFNRNPDTAKALMGKSRVREKDVVSWERFEAWCYDTLQEASRIETLMFLQQRVYDRPWSTISGSK
jgi:hypothetical protein